MLICVSVIFWHSVIVRRHMSSGSVEVAEKCRKKVVEEVKIVS